MKTWAKINENNQVIDLIKIADSKKSVKKWLTDRLGGTWEQTYSSTDVENGTDEQRNGKAAVIGGSFDPEKKMFIDPKPYPSWILDSNQEWVAPEPMPEGSFEWDEENTSWVETGSE